MAKIEKPAAIDRLNDIIAKLAHAVGIHVAPTIGGMIYWANAHSAMVSGIWWWIAFPVALIIMTFIGLFLLAVSMNEYLDPRSRLARMGRVAS